MVPTADPRRLEHLRLCRWARSHPPAAPRADPAIAGPVDWPHLLTTAERHGVKELLIASLRAPVWAAPPEVVAALEQHRLGTIAANLERTTQLIALLQRLRSRGIRALTFKGPAMTSAILGDLGHRLSSDLDLLVHPQDVARVRPLLLAEGYELLPRPRHRGGSLVYGLFPGAGRSDTLVARDSRLASVDIHVAFAHWTQGIRLDVEGLFARAVTVHVAGAPIPTLSPDDLLLVLAIHGMMHNWDALRFVSDIQAVAPHVGDWPAVVTRARAARMRRILWVALLLARDLLEAGIPATVLAEARRDSGAVDLARDIASRLFAARPTTPTAFDPAQWQLSFQDGRSGRIRFRARRLCYEWVLKWPWDEWLGRRTAAPGCAQAGPAPRP